MGHSVIKINTPHIIMMSYRYLTNVYLIHLILTQCIAIRLVAKPSSSSQDRPSIST